MSNGFAAKALGAGWVGLLLLIGGPDAPAQVTASVEVSTIAQNDPHPTTYQWDGAIPIVQDPGGHYYHFYYTGTVNPDARVPSESQIRRIPVTHSEWAENKRWIIAQLTLFYQQAYNLDPTALQDYQSPEDPYDPLGDDPAGAPGADFGPAFGPGMGPGFDPGMGPGMGPGLGPSAPGFPGEQQPQPQQPEQPVPDESGLIVDEAGEFDELEIEETPAGPGGGAPTAAPAQFDANVVAEWTFYYDQLVLWQYYCARILLDDMENRLLEPMPNARRRQTQLLDQVSGMRPDDLGPDLMAAGQMQQTEQGVFDPLASYAAGPGGLVADEEGLGEVAALEEEQMPFQAGGPGQVIVLREQFNPMRDYLEPDGGKRMEYLERFESAAEQLDELVYGQYIQMIEAIDERALNQEQYEEWIQDKRQEIFDFADIWRDLDQGDTLMIGETLFLISDEPLESVPDQTVNIVRQQRLTPQDLLNEDGTLRRPDY